MALNASAPRSECRLASRSKTRSCAVTQACLPHHERSKQHGVWHQHALVPVDATPRLRSTCARTLAPCRATSIDPLSLAQTVYKPGQTFIIHGATELELFTQKEPGKHKLTVLMAKSSHCRPCKKFAATYHAFAAQFSDCQMLEIVGDESKETRKMMVDMKVRVTPSFFLYREGQLLTTLTGTKQLKLRTAILQHLKPGEANTPDLSTTSEEEDSDDD